jgi:hypothetical protein
MSYGMPAYSRDGITEIGWASQKRYISLYVVRGDVLDAYRGQLAHLSVGKGCIRYRNPGGRFRRCPVDAYCGRSEPRAGLLNGSRRR